MSFIIYPQENGQVAVIIPAGDVNDAIKDIPFGKKYKIVDSLNINNDFFNSYIFDENQGAVLDFSKAKSQQNSNLNQLVYTENGHRAIKTLSGLTNVLSDSDWKTLLNISQAAIDNSTTTNELVSAIVPVQEAINANSAI
jgi:hypothetical protein